jgi:hypothetical protein
MVKRKIKWSNESKKDNYKAARTYLTLLYGEKRAAKCVAGLKKADTAEFEAKDIFRASGISLLNVEKDCNGTDLNKEVSPILLVRDKGFGRIIIADGYHRMCSVYARDEEAMIRCKIV